MKLNKDKNPFSVLEGASNKQRSSRTLSVPKAAVNEVPVSKQLQDQLEYLDDKLSKTRKNISAYDIYKITEIVTSPDDFSTQVARLLPNTSLIINCKNFEIGNKVYSKGDIITKDNNGNENLISAENGGIYFPSQITQSEGNYNITYSYSSNSAIDGTAKISLNGSPLTQPMKNIMVQGIQDNYKGGIYGVAMTITADSFEVTSQSEVRPLVKFFTKSKEELVCPYTIKLNKSGQSCIWTISGYPTGLIDSVVIK